MIFSMSRLHYFIFAVLMAGFAALGYVVYVPYKAWKDQIPN